jgi:hypothetical protein
MPKLKREDKVVVKAAKEYVARQIATMKAHGKAPKLSTDDFNEIVRKVAEATK